MASSKHPNFIFVFDDQHRHSAMGCYGNEVVKTPHLDAFSQESRVFDHCYSCCPISSPYRGQLFTGRYSHQNGVMCNEYKLRDDQTFFPQAFKQAGYGTYYVGKWHLGYEPYTEDKRYGFDRMAAYNCIHDPYNTEYYDNEEGPIEMKGWAPEIETDLALKFIEEHRTAKPDDPFALFLSWGPPHWPYDQYPDAFDVYDPAEVDLPPNVPVQMEAFARYELAHYYGNVTALDAQFGRIVAALDKLKLADDTVLVFTSDHGDHLGSHGYGKPGDMWLHNSKRASKATPYEESIHVPFIIRWPKNIPADTRSDAILSSADLMPSLLSLCGVESPASVSGADYSHHFKAEDGPEADSAYLQILGEGWPNRGRWVGFWRGLRTKRWTYARWLDHEYETVLFDNQIDPHQMYNLAKHPDLQEIVATLETRLQQWIIDTADPFETGKREPHSGVLELGQTFINERHNARRDDLGKAFKAQKAATSKRKRRLARGLKARK